MTPEPSISSTPEADQVPQATPVVNLPQLMRAIERQHRLPILNLRQALVVLGILDEDTLRALQREDPDLLRCRSHELVTRLLLTDDELHRALARVAGIVEIEVLGFEIERSAFDLLPLRQVHAHSVVPLGMANEQFYVASCAPTSSELQHALCTLTGHSVALVWASREAIERRLEVQERIEHAGHGHSPQAIVAEVRRRLLPTQPVGSAHSPSAELEDMVMQALVEVGSGVEAEQMASAAESAGMVRLVNQMITAARAARASDIHIETNPGEALTAIRFRRDGDLEHYLWLPAKLRGPLVSRVKIMARLDIAERHRP